MRLGMKSIQPKIKDSMNFRGEATEKTHFLISYTEEESVSRKPKFYTSKELTLNSE